MKTETKMICFFCRSDQVGPSKYRRKTIWNATEFSYFLCRICNAFSLYPVLNKLQLSKLYSNEYSKQESQDDSSYEKYFADHGDQYSTRYLRDNLKPGDLLCDFGCGFDKTIASLSKSIGASYIGIEYEPSVVSALSSQDPEVRYLTSDAFLNSKQKFDFIFLGDVLEHVVSPVELLINLSDKLKSDGRLVIQGPLENARTFLHLLVKLKSAVMLGSALPQHPYHVSLASRKSMTRLFQSSHLEEIVLITYEVWWPVSNNDRQSIKNLFNLMYLAKFLDTKLQHLIPSYGNRFFAVLKSQQFNY